MKKRKNRNYVIVATLGVLLAVSSCEGISSHQGVMDRIKNADLPLKKTEPTYPASPGPRVLVKIEYQGGSFFTRTRKDKMERFQCSSCHTGRTVAVNEAGKAAHGNIELQHGAVDRPDACETCHNPHDRDFLSGENGQKIDFDHSYQMCGNCHFRQKKDWIGGAHGKRVENWEGERIVLNCVDCHNPHSPRFPKRWPTTFSPPDPLLTGLEQLAGTGEQ